MRKDAVPVSLLTLMLAIGGCGGDSRGLSGSATVFTTAVVHIKSSQPPTLESDVIVRFRVDTMVASSFSTGCNVPAQGQVCLGSTFRGDNLTLTFVVETIKNAQGQAVTPNPSPILVEKYRVRFTGCIPGTYEFPVGHVLTPGETQVTIQPITPDMKRSIVVPGNFVYVHDDGCLTQFNALTYQGICNAVAQFEFDLVEINSGMRKTMGYNLTVRLADFTTQDDQCVR